MATFEPKVIYTETFENLMKASPIPKYVEEEWRREKALGRVGGFISPLPYNKATLTPMAQVIQSMKNKPRQKGTTISHKITDAMSRGQATRNQQAGDLSSMLESHEHDHSVHSKGYQLNDVSQRASSQAESVLGTNASFAGEAIPSSPVLKRSINRILSSLESEPEDNIESPQKIVSVSKLGYAANRMPKKKNLMDSLKSTANTDNLIDADSLISEDDNSRDLASQKENVNPGDSSLEKEFSKPAKVTGKKVDEPANSLDNALGDNHPAQDWSKDKQLVSVKVENNACEIDSLKGGLGKAKPVKPVKETVLHSWIIKPLELCHGLAVEGQRSQDPPDSFWQSSKIVERVGDRTVKTATGAVYKLVGNIDVPFVIEAGFTKSVARTFLEGFPANWDTVIKNFYKRKAKGGMKQNQTFAASKSKPSPVITKGRSSEPGWFNFGTPSDVILDELPKTRSGRMVKPLLAWWAGQRVRIHGKTGKVEITAVESPSLNMSFDNIAVRQANHSLCYKPTRGHGALKGNAGNVKSEGKNKAGSNAKPAVCKLLVEKLMLEEESCKSDKDISSIKNIKGKQDVDSKKENDLKQKPNQKMAKLPNKTTVQEKNPKENESENNLKNFKGKKTTKKSAKRIDLTSDSPESECESEHNELKPGTDSSSECSDNEIDTTVSRGRHKNRKRIPSRQIPKENKSENNFKNFKGKKTTKKSAKRIDLSSDSSESEHNELKPGTDSSSECSDNEIGTTVSRGRQKNRKRIPSRQIPKENKSENNFKGKKTTKKSAKRIDLSSDSSESEHNELKPGTDSSSECSDNEIDTTVSRGRQKNRKLIPSRQIPKENKSENNFKNFKGKKTTKKSAKTIDLTSDSSESESESEHNELKPGTDSSSECSDNEIDTTVSRGRQKNRKRIPSHQKLYQQKQASGKIVTENRKNNKGGNKQRDYSSSSDEDEREASNPRRSNRKSGEVRQQQQPQDKGRVTRSSNKNTQLCYKEKDSGADCSYNESDSEQAEKKKKPPPKQAEKKKKLPPKKEPMKKPAKTFVPKKVEYNTDSTKPWSKKESATLYKAVETYSPDNPQFWDLVAGTLPLRSVEECQEFYYRTAPDTANKPKAKSQKPHKPVSLSGKVGTLKRKRELRELMDQHHDGYEDDFFDSTPMKKQSCKAPVMNKDDDEDIFGDKLPFDTPSATRTPFLKHFDPVSTRKTPRLSGYSPVYGNTVDRNEVDRYVNRLKKKRKITPEMKANNKNNKKGKLKEVEYEDGLFRREEEPQDKDSEVESDYYWSDE